MQHTVVQSHIQSYIKEHLTECIINRILNLTHTISIILTVCTSTVSN